MDLLAVGAAGACLDPPVSLDTALDASQLPEAITPDSPIYPRLNDFLIRIRMATDDR